MQVLTNIIYLLLWGFVSALLAVAPLFHVSGTAGMDALPFMVLFALSGIVGFFVPSLLRRYVRVKRPVMLSLLVGLSFSVVSFITLSINETILQKLNPDCCGFDYAVPPTDGILKNEAALIVLFVLAWIIGVITQKLVSRKNKKVQQKKYAIGIGPFMSILIVLLLILVAILFVGNYTFIMSGYHKQVAQQVQQNIEQNQNEQNTMKLESLPEFVVYNPPDGTVNLSDFVIDKDTLSYAKSFQHRFPDNSILYYDYDEEFQKNPTPIEQSIAKEISADGSSAQRLTINTISAVYFEYQYNSNFNPEAQLHLYMSPNITIQISTSYTGASPKDKLFSIAQRLQPHN